MSVLETIQQKQLLIPVLYSREKFLENRNAFKDQINLRKQ